MTKNHFTVNACQQKSESGPIFDSSKVLKNWISCTHPFPFLSEICCASRNNVIILKKVDFVRRFTWILSKLNLNLGRAFRFWDILTEFKSFQYSNYPGTIFGNVGDIFSAEIPTLNGSKPIKTDQNENIKVDPARMFGGV